MNGWGSAILLVIGVLSLEDAVDSVRQKRLVIYPKRLAKEIDFAPIDSASGQVYRRESNLKREPKRKTSQEPTPKDGLVNNYDNWQDNSYLEPHVYYEEEHKPHGEVHYHKHEHVHEHEHKQDHVHQHKQEHHHKHMHNQKHEHRHHSDHKNHHQHQHQHEHKQEHKHNHHHGHDHHQEHKHSHNHDHKHKHRNEHKHRHRHGHKYGNKHY